MKPQADAFVEKANELVTQAETMLSVGLYDSAGRTAYLAAFHAAQAFLFERFDRVFKKHASVQSEFGRLTRDNEQIDAHLRSFLPHAYSLKAVADYGIGPDAHVSAEDANEATQTARRFVEAVTRLLPSGEAP